MNTIKLFLSIQKDFKISVTYYKLENGDFLLIFANILIF